ncbi:MAG: AI-2E family transporter [Lachnospiraceae bacterium]|nr:AI-2E family transporter [Lachnospiraceae bacterium]
MKLNKDITKQKWFAYTTATCSAVLLYLVLTHLTYYLGIVGKFFKIIGPIVIGLVIAYLLSPICAFFERRFEKGIKQEKLRRTVAVVVTLLLVLAVIIVLFVAFVPQLVGSIAYLFSNMYNYIVGLERWVKDISDFAESMNINVIDFSGKITEFLNDILTKLPGKMDSFVSTGIKVGMSVSNFLLGVFIAIYLLMDEKRMTTGVKRVLRATLSTEKYHRTAVFWARCNSIMLRYLGLDILDGFVVGIINMVFMLIFRMPYAVLVSVIVGVTNLAPTFGPIIGGVIGALILVLVNPGYAFLFIIFTIVLQTLDGYIIKPKLFGSSLGVPAVWILISIIVGGKLFGVLGILLAIPFASIINFLYEDVIDAKIEEKCQEQREKGKEFQEKLLAEEAQKQQESDGR